MPSPLATTRRRRPFLRQAIVDAIASMSRTGNAELQERRARLERTEERLRNLVDFISRGEMFLGLCQASKWRVASGSRGLRGNRSRPHARTYVRIRANQVG